jgi:hypothetical protein
MAENDWLSSGDAGWGGASGEVHSPPPPVARHELRPLSTGEILDRTFYLYRSRFWLYVGLSSFAAGVSVLGTIGKLAYLHFKAPVAAGAASAMLVGSVFVILGTILSFVAYSVTQAATVSAVSSIYLGEETSIGAAFRAVRRHWLRYCLIALWQAWSGGWIFMLLFVPALVIPGLGITSLNWLVGLMMFGAFGSLIYGIIAYLRNSLAVPAAVVEDLRVRAAMARSKYLVAGRKGRIFLLFLLLGALYMVAGMMQFPFAVLILHSRSAEHVLVQILSLVVAFLCNALVGPVGAIALCLFYIDERVRKEAFDIEFLMNKTVRPAVDVATGDSTVELA